MRGDAAQGCTTGMPFADANADGARLILCHKQKTSARLRFLQFPHGALAFSPLPAGAVIQSGSSHPHIEMHPAAWVHQACARLGMSVSGLCAEPEFHAEAHCKEGVITILLATFTAIDPPFDIAQAHAARFAAITEMRACPPAELTLLRMVYEHLIG